MANPVGIITDSTSYIPKEYIANYRIRIAPQIVIWGEESFRDGVDIQPQEFYQRLQVSSKMPKTSQATPASMEQLYREYQEEGYDILAILISEKLSGTTSSALQAKQLFPDARIEIVDSYTTAMALGFQVLTVAKAAADGADIDECKALAERARDHTGVVFAVDTLEFLHRGGRIGGGARFIGTALNFKPILEVKDGAIDAVERVRTRKKSLNRLAELVAERTAGQKPLRLATLHANALEEARKLLEETAKMLDADETILSEVSPAVGTHAGPGVIGLAYMAGL